jgi:transcriptional regulator with XRE-family HTH domain
MAEANRLSAATVEAARILGGRVRLARHRRGWTIAELASRVGVTPKTMLKVESGDPTVRLGVAFEAAVLTGVPLFASDPRQRALERTNVEQQLALLPARARPLPEVDDDF